MSESIPYRFEPTHHAGELHEAHDDIEAGTETDTVVTVAGRLMLRRVQGKLAFGTMQDQTGRIQLFAPVSTTPRFSEFTSLTIGDWVGVTGVVMKTRKGELSIRVDEWVLLAHSERQFPDKWHGMTDPEARYRQRYVDLWVSDGARSAFLLRSRALSLIRRWLEDRQFIEVETPLLNVIPGGGHARPFVTHHNALDTDLYLRIAPELFLKRLVVGGFERVFEMGRTFRNEGIDRVHNPEFTMLELYQAYGDVNDMMAITEELIGYLATELRGTTKLTWQGQEVDLTPPWRRASMADLIEERIGVRIDVRMPIDDVRHIAFDQGVKVEQGWGQGKLMLEIYEKTTESSLQGPVFVTDYPKEVSPLARDHRELPDMVERFEVIVGGREIANAFSELTDPKEQKARFDGQLRARAAGDDEAMPVDDDYVRALEYGLPPTGGLGIGIDRLVMMLADVASIRDIVLFPTLRPESAGRAPSGTHADGDDEADDEA
ncbi:MAG: lysyl-tRNA synthetase, class [Actinomycetota bacterium]|nr:lysyl-tRNA synthetase, class [Actinomycetota bacterium]